MLETNYWPDHVISIKKAIVIQWQSSVAMPPQRHRRGQTLQAVVSILIFKWVTDIQQSTFLRSYIYYDPTACLLSQFHAAFKGKTYAQTKWVVESLASNPVNLFVAECQERSYFHWVTDFFLDNYNHFFGLSLFIACSIAKFLPQYLINRFCPSDLLIYTNIYISI